MPYIQFIKSDYKRYMTPSKHNQYDVKKPGQLPGICVWQGIVVRKDIVRVILLLQSRQTRQFASSVTLLQCLVTVCIVDVDRQSGVARSRGPGVAKLAPKLSTGLRSRVASCVSRGCFDAELAVGVIRLVNDFSSPTYRGANYLHVPQCISEGISSCVIRHSGHGLIGKCLEIDGRPACVGVRLEEIVHFFKGRLERRA